MSRLEQNREFWKHPAVVVLGSLVLYFAAQLLGVIFVLPFVGFVSNKNAQSMILLVGVFLAFLTLLVVAMRSLRFRWHDIGVSAGKLRYIGLVPVALAAYVVLSASFMTLAQKIPGFDANQAQDVGLVTTGSSNIVLGFIVLVIITPLFEELLFRGLLFHGLRRRLPFLAGAVIGSLAFALAHGQANVAVDTFALGMLLCLLTEHSKSLLPSVLLHALKNFLAFGVLFLNWGK